MQSTISTKQLRQSICGTGTLILSAERNRLRVISESPTSITSISIPSLNSESGVACVEISANVLTKLAAHFAGEVTLEFCVDAVVVSTQNAFVSINSTQCSAANFSESPESVPVTISADLLYALMRQVSAVSAMLKPRDRALTFCATRDCLLVSTSGNEARAKVPCQPRFSGSWTVPSSDALTLVRLLKKSKATDVEVATTEGDLLIFCDDWSVRFTRQSEVSERVNTQSGNGVTALCHDLRRSLAHMLAVCAAEAKLESKAKALAVTCSQAKSLLRCSGRISATWDVKLLHAFVKHTGGQITISESQAATQFATLNNPLSKTNKKETTCRQSLLATA